MIGEFGFNPGTAGNQNYLVAGKASVDFQTPEQMSKPENMPIMYQFHDPEAGKWKLITASTVVLRPTRREICIFSWDERYQRVDYHGITFPVTP